MHVIDSHILKSGMRGGWVFVLSALCTYSGVTGIPYIEFILIPVQAWLSWMTIKWIVANISANGRPLQLSFRGDAMHYVDGTRREIIFNASGLEVLWRTVVVAIGCILIIPIPWVLGWIARWYISQIELAPRAA